jgi:hypothetical protein
MSHRPSPIEPSEPIGAFFDLEPADRAALREEALRLAPVLRREAMAAFWRDADARVVAALGLAQRSATRLAQRIARHRRQRLGLEA